MKKSRAFAVCLVATLSFSAMLAAPAFAQFKQYHNTGQRRANDWQYSDYTDSASGARIHNATKKTDELTPAKNGAVIGQIFLFANPAPYLNLSIKAIDDSAMLDCSTPCSIVIQFDDDSPIEVKGKVLETRRHVSLDGAAGLIEKIKAAHEMKITAPVKGDGPLEFDFTIGDLEWPRDDK